MNVGDQYVHKASGRLVEIVAIKQLCVFIREPGSIIEELMSTEQFLWHFKPKEPEQATEGIDYWRGGLT